MDKDKVDIMNFFEKLENEMVINNFDNFIQEFKTFKDEIICSICFNLFH